MRIKVTNSGLRDMAFRVYGGLKVVERAHGDRPNVAVFDADGDWLNDQRIAMLAGKGCVVEVLDEPEPEGDPLAALRAEAKELGVQSWHLLGEDKLREGIEAAKAAQ